MEADKQKELEEALDKAKEMAERNEVYICSSEVWHIESCDGECGIRTLTESEVKLNEETEKWNELEMSFLGVPAAYSGKIPVGGIPVELFHAEVAFGALIDYLCEKGLADKEELNEGFRKEMITRLKSIREANEEKIIEARRRSKIAVTPQIPEIELPFAARRKMH